MTMLGNLEAWSIILVIKDFDISRAHFAVSFCGEIICSTYAGKKTSVSLCWALAFTGMV